MAGVWMSCNFGIRITSVEGNTQKDLVCGALDWDLGISCSEGVFAWQGSSGWL